jgi:hypothetical protein
VHRCDAARTHGSQLAVGNSCFGLGRRARGDWTTEYVVMCLSSQGNSRALGGDKTCAAAVGVMRSILPEAFSSSSDMFTKTDERILPHQWFVELEWCRLCW